MSDPGPELRRRLAEASRLEALDRLDAAARLFEAAATAHPGRHDVVHQCGVVALKQGRLEDAVRFVSAALAAAPQEARYHRSLGELLRRSGDAEAAADHARAAVRLEPEAADGWYNLGVALYDLVDLTGAEAALRRALLLDSGHAGAHFELAEVLLATGRYDEGWRAFDWRFRIPGARRPRPPGPAPAWDGRPVEGTLLVMADQGFGDIAMFARFLPWAAGRCSRLVVIGQTAALPIVRAADGVDRAVDRWDGLPPVVAHAALSDLPGLAGVRLETLPASPVPYLRAEAGTLRRWRARLDQALPASIKRVGIAWSGRAAFGDDRGRSLAFADLAPLTALKDVALVSVQLGPARDDLTGYAGRAPLLDLGGEIADFADTLAILDRLDHIVSIDTSIAHLAGALGRPVEVLLRRAADWRWLVGRSDSPWHPTARLHRQTAPGRWAEPVQAAAARIAAPG